MEYLEKTVLKAQFEGLKPHLQITDEKEILFSSFVTREYIYFIMPFLNTLFILQDRIMMFLGHFLNIKNTLPDKLLGYYNIDKRKINKIVLSFPKPIQTLLINYCEKHGEIRKYRNLDQHQYQLYYHSFYRLKPKEEYVIYLPDKITKNMNLHDITYKKKIVALDLFKREFKAFHDFVESMLIQLKIQPKEMQPKQSLEPLERLAKYKNGAILSILVIGNEAIAYSISNNNDPTSKAKKIDIQTEPNKITSFSWALS